MMKTFNEIWEWLSGYLCRAHGEDRDMTALVRLDNLKSAHERELAAAKAELPLVEYDVAENERHKVACKLREWADDMINGSSYYSMRALYDALFGEDAGDLLEKQVAISIRDRLIELLES